MVKNGARKKSSGISVLHGNACEVTCAHFCIFCSRNYYCGYGINAKDAFFSTNERSQGEGKGKEEERKEERERDIGSEALEETEKIANAPAGNRTWDLGPRTPANATDALPLSHRHKRHHLYCGCHDYYFYLLHQPARQNMEVIPK